jgi:glucosyl-3-phosphoglycerate phosphatase
MPLQMLNSINNCLNFAVHRASRQAKNEEIHMVQRIFIVRHGETDYNAQHRWQGQINVPLNALGLAQAEKLGTHFADIELDAIISSDLERAYQTAFAIARLKGIQIVKDARLREMALGDFEGLTRPELDAKFAQEVINWYASDDFAPPNGESRMQTQARILAAWQEIVTYDEYETILLLSHGGTMRQLMKKLIPSQMEGIRFGNTSISLLEKHNDEWHGVFLSKTPHLE